MRALKRDRSASAVIGGHAFVQNVRRGHYEPGLKVDPISRLEAAFDQLIPTIQN